jgi:hypothetical protein
MGLKTVLKKIVKHPDRKEKNKHDDVEDLHGASVIMVRCRINGTNITSE